MTRILRRYRYLPLVLILFVIAAGFFTNFMSHQKSAAQHKLANSHIHNAQAKMLLGETIASQLREVSNAFRFLHSVQDHPDHLSLETSDEALNEIHRALDVYIRGGVFKKNIALNLPGREEATIEISFTPSQDSTYNLEVLTLSAQTLELEEKLAESSRTIGHQHSRLVKKINSLIQRMEENANKLFFDSQSELHLIHSDISSLLEESSRAAMMHALSVLSCISILIALIYKQISNTRAELETSVKSLSNAQNDLMMKNTLILTFNESLEVKVAERTLELEIEIAERKKIENQLADKRKFEAIGQLAGGIAHDFNNVLTVISGYGGMLKRRLRDDEQASADAETILTAAKKAEGLTRQLLAFGRKQVLSPKTIELNTFLTENKVLLSRLLPKNIEFDINYATDPVPIMADPSQIDQVLINLIVNARDALDDEHGFIQISLGQSGLSKSLKLQFPHEVDRTFGCITVADNGHGIPKEIQNRIFDPFFTTKAQGQGTGLGLSTVYGIVKQSEGYIMLESDKGCGCCFHIYLPLSEDRDLRPEVKSPPVQQKAIVKTILLVDDEEAILFLLSESLQKSGHKVLSSLSADEALVLWDKYSQDIDILVTDVGLHKTSGIQLAEKIRTSNKQLPVLFISGYGDIHQKKSFGVKDFHFLQKPFEAAELNKEIDSIFSVN